MTIIDRVGSLAMSFSTVRARGKLCDIHGFLPMKTDDLGVLELAARVAAVQVRVDPGLAGLLLRQRVRPVTRADRLEERAAVGAAQVVTLAAAAVVEDLVAAVGRRGCA